MTTKLKAAVTFGIMCLVLSGPAWSATDAETLLGIDVTRTKLKIHVGSGGCTKKEHFNIAVEEAADGSKRAVTIVRTEPDTCKKLVPNGKWITFEREELGLGGAMEFDITNPIGSTPFAQ